jgi:trk system potassium uptake protein TrkA
MLSYIVIGCGRVGTELAYRLSKNGQKVCVVDQDPRAFDMLPINFRGRTLEGDALNQIVLRRSGMESADGVAVVTGSDTINAVIGHVARSVYQVPNVIVRNYDPRFRSLLEAFHLQTVASTSWGAQRIEELLYHQELRTIFSAGNGEVEVYEFTVPSAWQGRQLVEFIPAEGCCPSAITRSGRAHLPDSTFVLQQGDVVLLSATMAGAEAMRQIIDRTQEA